MSSYNNFLYVLNKPSIIFAFLMSVGMMIVNGWTDAPVNIATALKSKAIGFKKAVLLSAICNLLGAAAMFALGNSVAINTLMLSGLTVQGSSALLGVISAMLSVIIWSLIALYFGLPTSESHALLAALSGAAVALIGKDGFITSQWLKVLLGLVLSTAPVMIFSFWLAVFLKRHANIGDSTFKKLQILGAAMSSFAHGAQDGQKFAGILVLTTLLSSQKTYDNSLSIPLWAMAVSAFFISLGTLLGGKKIIKSLDTFAPSDSASGFAADLSSSICLTIISLLGFPTGTTCAKTCAVFGAGFSETNSLKKNGKIKFMILAWVLTFPLCAIISFILAKVLNLLIYPAFHNM